MRGQDSGEAIRPPVNRPANARYGWIHTGGKNQGAEGSLGSAYYDAKFGGEAGGWCAVPGAWNFRVSFEANPPVGNARRDHSRSQRGRYESAHSALDSLYFA